MRKLLFLMLCLGVFLPTQTMINNKNPQRAIEKPQDDPEIISLERIMKELGIETGKLQIKLNSTTNKNEKIAIQKKIKENEIKLEKLIKRYTHAMERFQNR